MGSRRGSKAKPMSKPHPYESTRWQVYNDAWKANGTRQDPEYLEDYGLDERPWVARASSMSYFESEKHRQFETFAQAIDWATRKARAELGPPNPPYPPTWARPVG